MYTFLELGFDRSVFTILSTEMIQKLNQARQIAPQFNIDLSHNNNFKKKKKIFESCRFPKIIGLKRLEYSVVEEWNIVFLAKDPLRRTDYKNHKLRELK